MTAASEWVLLEIVREVVAVMGMSPEGFPAKMARQKVQAMCKVNPEKADALVSRIKQLVA